MLPSAPGQPFSTGPGVTANGRNAAAPSAQPGVGKEACLGDAGTEMASFIKTSNKASRCLGRDGAWRSGMCLNSIFVFDW